MILDFWYNNTLADVVGIDCYFYGNDGEYRGWMYNANGKIIGDYTTTDSLKIEQTFNVRFAD